jgi:hypothetical protein
MAIALVLSQIRRDTQMKKSTSLIAMSLLAAFLIIPSGRGYAKDDPPGNHREREELRRDRQQLEELRRRRAQEIREGDRREAREYNEKIRDKQREVRGDLRDIYGDRDGGNRDGWNWGGWNRDRRDRDRYDRD